MNRVQRLAADVLRTGDTVVRRLAPQLRLDPDFVILGAQRAGTTSLYNYPCSRASTAGRARRSMRTSAPSWCDTSALTMSACTPFSGEISAGDR